MYNSKFFVRMFVVICFFSSFAQADEQTELKTLLKNNTYAIKFDNGSLNGPGADLILELAENTQFVALGEEHNNFDIPGITTALFEALHKRYGYQYFMTEQDPVMMELLSNSPARGDLEKISALAKAYPMGLTFISDQELKMLADLGRISTADHDVIWGCDQGSGVTHTLDQLLVELEDQQAIAAVGEFRELAAQQETVRDYSSGHFMYDAELKDLVHLKAKVNAGKGTHAAWLMDVLVNSSRIFDFYKNGNKNILPGYYENNRFREQHLKDLCLAKYRAIEPSNPLPKALMKFGSWHIYEGLSPTRIHTIGDFFSNVAQFNNQKFLSVHFSSRPQEPEKNMQHLGFIWPFIQDLPADEFAVVDLRAFREYPNRILIENTQGEEWGKTYKESYRRLVYGYDLIFFVGNTKAATFEIVPGK